MTEADLALISELHRVFDNAVAGHISVGKGTGLGLALVYNVIVTKHGGTIEVGGEEGKGAMFTLGLPVV